MSDYTTTYTARKPITKDESKQLIVEARLFTDHPSEIIAYERKNGMLFKAYSLPLPKEGWTSVATLSSEELLEYVRERIPPTLHLG